MRTARCARRCLPLHVYSGCHLAHVLLAALVMQLNRTRGTREACGVVADGLHAVGITALPTFATHAVAAH